MHRQILEACLPCLIALAVACVALRVLIRVSGASFQWKRLREIHRCQEGGVQSLAFVLTLPMFLVIAQFIVQVNQLMIGVMVVNYAAYASARSAAVWIPAEIGDFRQNKSSDSLGDRSGGLAEGVSVKLRLDDPSGALSSNPKYQQIFKAAALACAPVSPSRDLGYSPDQTNSNTVAVAQAMYGQLVPASKSNDRINQRLSNKIAWSYQNTSVEISFLDKNSRTGWTHNPREWVYSDLTEEWELHWDPHEVGWQDPFTCTVTHQFALLPGPGRVLAKYLVRADGEPDNIPERIEQSTGPSREKVYTTQIWATATSTVEGLKSVIPYVQTP